MKPRKRASADLMGKAKGTVWLHPPVGAQEVEEKL
jgi:hypothetical protein